MPGSGERAALAAGCPADLSITTADRRRLAEERRCAACLGRSLRRVWGAYLVHGSPAQRRGERGRSARRPGGLALLASRAGGGGVRRLFASSLWRRRLQLRQHLAEAAEIVRRLGNPALRIMVDTLAASLMGLSRGRRRSRWMPSGLLAHVQFNDRNRRGPGQGEDRFAPIIRALRETAYGGWIAMELFVYEPDGPSCAAHDRLRRRPAGAARMKVKLEVERYEAACEDAACFPLRRHHGHRCHPGGDQGARRAVGRPNQRGVAAEALAAKWFEKARRSRDAQDLEQLRQALDLAIELYRAHGFHTPFDLFAGTYAEQQRRGAQFRSQSTGRCLRPGLLDRAILDAVGRAASRSPDGQDQRSRAFAPRR